MPSRMRASRLPPWQAASQGTACSTGRCQASLPAPTLVQTTVTLVSLFPSTYLRHSQCASKQVRASPCTAACWFQPRVLHSMTMGSGLHAPCTLGAAA